jgi:hypothetical protein
MYHGNRWIRRVAAASKLCLALSLSSCGSSNPTQTTEPGPSARVPTPTSTASPYAGSWMFTIWLTAVDRQCGHTESDIDVRVGPIPVTIAADGSFSVPSPVNATGTIVSADDVRIRFAERPTCPAGNGAGGCVNLNHCDGTSNQAGDVSKWILNRS